MRSVRYSGSRGGGGFWPGVSGVVMGWWGVCQGLVSAQEGVSAPVHAGIHIPRVNRITDASENKML